MRFLIQRPCENSNGYLEIFKGDNFVKKQKILIVMGGTSSEREISLRSGQAVFEALVRLGYNVEKFILNQNNVKELLMIKPDLCVLALHGKGGEDGSIQGMLELAGIRYTGSGIVSSAMCMNKIITKKMLSHRNIPTPRFAEIKKGENIEEFSKNLIKNFDFPMVVKAPCQGSSVGVEIVHNFEELTNAIKNNIEYDNEILIEEFINGIELTVPVMKQGCSAIAFPIVEIVSENTFYDYESKYTEGMSHHIIPARVNEEAAEKISQYAVDAYNALSCSGIARVDFFIDKDNNPYVIEINTIPGMTATSLVPDSAKAAGINFDELVEKIVIEAF